MRKNFKLLGAVAVAGIVATTGSAFTAGTTMSDASDTVAYGTASVSGATVSTIEHVLNGAGNNIDSVVLTLTQNHLTSTVKAGFGASGANTTCTLVTAYGDSAPTTDGFDSAAGGTTRFTCPVNTATSGATSLAVTVQNDAPPA